MRWSVLLSVLLVTAPAAAQSQGERVNTEADDACAESAVRDAAGRLALRRGVIHAARGDFETAFILCPTVERGWALLDVTEAELDVRASIATLERILELGPEDARAAEARARLETLRGIAETAVPEPPGDDVDEDDELDEDDEVDEAAADATEPAESPEPPVSREVWDEPWFWAIVAVVAGGGIGVALFLSADPGVEAPIPGDAGVVVHTLVEWP